MRMGNSEPSHHEDHIAGKGEISLQHHNLVHKFIPMLQAMKIPAAQAAVDKEWEKLEKISAWNLNRPSSPCAPTTLTPRLTTCATGSLVTYDDTFPLTQAADEVSAYTQVK